jgi:hypothetical protein
MGHWGQPFSVAGSAVAALNWALSTQTQGFWLPWPEPANTQTFRLRPSRRLSSQFTTARPSPELLAENISLIAEQCGCQHGLAGRH